MGFKNPPTPGSSRTVTGTDIATASDRFLLLDPSGGSFIETLPAAAGYLGILSLRVLNTNTNVVTLAGPTVDGTTNATLGPVGAQSTYTGAVLLISDGANWRTLNPPQPFSRYLRLTTQGATYTTPPGIANIRVKVTGCAGGGGGGGSANTAIAQSGGSGGNAGVTFDQVVPGTAGEVFPLDMSSGGGSGIGGLGGAAGGNAGADGAAGNTTNFYGSTGSTGGSADGGSGGKGAPANFTGLVGCRPWGVGGPGSSPTAPTINQVSLPNGSGGMGYGGTASVNLSNSQQPTYAGACGGSGGSKSSTTQGGAGGRAAIAPTVTQQNGRGTLTGNVNGGTGDTAVQPGSGGGGGGGGANGGAGGNGGNGATGMAEVWW